MAIVLEEEKKGTGIWALLGWLIVIAIIAVAGYYIFFISPASVVIVPSNNLENIAPISQSALSAESVLQSANFQSLKAYVPTSSVTSVPVGRANPFLSP